MSWVLLLLSGLLVFWLRWRQKNRCLLKKASSFPGPPGLPFLGNALSFIVSPEGKFDLTLMVVEEQSTYFLKFINSLLSHLEYFSIEMDIILISDSGYKNTYTKNKFACIAALDRLKLNTLKIKLERMSPKYFIKLHPSSFLLFMIGPGLH